jgi:hypothetical protein
MALPQGDTTQSSIHSAQQTEIDSRTGHNQPVMKLVGSSTRGSRSTTPWHRIPWPQRMLIDQLTPHLSKDNEEVNAHMKHLQEMLDAAIIVDLVLDRDDEAWGHEPDHRQSLRGDSASSLTPLEECS